MKIYDYSFLKNRQVPVSFLQITGGIYSLRSDSDNRKNIYPDIFTSLQKLAVVQSVKSSNAIEGIITTDKRIEEIVNKNSAPMNHNEAEIAGYRDVLGIIHRDNSVLSVSESVILQMHGILLSYTDFPNSGAYKTEDNIIREVLKDGTSRIRWNPVSAVDTPNAMQQLILAYIDARDDSKINPLLLIPCFVLDFLCIHPFRDGNGRMSRLLTILLLYKAGFDVVKYISFEEQINRIKDRYYDALKKSSEGWHENQNDYLPFMENFLYTLYFCYKELDKRFLTFGTEKVSKNKRVEAVVLNSLTPVSKRQIMELVPDVSVCTVEMVLADLLKSRKIKKLGNTINARYFKEI